MGFLDLCVIQAIQRHLRLPLWTALASIRDCRVIGVLVVGKSFGATTRCSCERLQRGRVSGAERQGEVAWTVEMLNRGPTTRHGAKNSWSSFGGSRERYSRSSARQRGNHSTSSSTKKKGLSSEPERACVVMGPHHGKASVEPSGIGSKERK